MDLLSTSKRLPTQPRAAPSLHSIPRLALTALGVVGLCAALPAQSLMLQAPPPARIVIVPADPGIAIGGDCNSPAVWVNGQLRVYASPFPFGTFLGGASWYQSGPSIESLGSTAGVNPDRSLLSTSTPIALGPWFESMISDKDGVLWAYYHAEFYDSVIQKIHPRIGAQVSRDNGITWQDLGIVLDTPAGTDEPSSRLGYGFGGGNGDFTALLDPTETYLYFFFSQYGSGPEDQGIGVARMLWIDRATPSGRLRKWHLNTWQESGLGGQAHPILANVGDAHGLRGPIDFWWGPSVHWNTHLQRYVMLLNRSTNGGFTNPGAAANWFMTGTRLEDPSSWDAPQPLVYPDNYKGGWYPEVIGVGANQTDRLVGSTARFFVEGHSGWKAYFLRPGESLAGDTIDSAPTVAIPLPDQIAQVGQLFTAILPETTFADAEGDVLTWTAMGLPDWLSLDPSTHIFSGTPPFDQLGKKTSVMITATDPYGLSATTSFSLTILALGGPPSANLDTRPQLQITVGNGASDLQVAIGATLTVIGRATDRDGDMSEHWLEIQNPAGQWDWEGWLTGEPWTGALAGDTFESVKSAAFTFNDRGTYTIRTTATDGRGIWLLSTEVHVHVGPSTLPLAEITIGGSANGLRIVPGTTLTITGRATDPNGRLVDHWLEIQNVDGQWSWEGWLTDRSWSGGLVGDAFESSKTATFTFDRKGIYSVRCSAENAEGIWILSSSIFVEVIDREITP